MQIYLIKKKDNAMKYMVLFTENELKCNVQYNNNNKQKILINLHLPPLQNQVLVGCGG